MSSPPATPNIAAANVNSADDVRRLSKLLVSHSMELKKANQQLRDFLYAG